VVNSHSSNPRISLHEAQTQSIVRSNWSSNLFALCVGAALLVSAPVRLTAQNQEEPESAAHAAWDWLKQGHPYANIRYRFEIFERDGAPFTAPAYALTLRLALGYETPSFQGFTAFAQLEAVEITGLADYNDPTLPPQNRPDRPTILDPKSLELSQGYVTWTHSVDHKNLQLRIGRQELTLNDGRFLSVSSWRQIHGSFDSAKLDADLSHNFSFTYAFVNRFYREAGYDATDGQPPMHTIQIMNISTPRSFLGIGRTKIAARLAHLIERSGLIHAL
jgi:Alginate export